MQRNISTLVDELREGRLDRRSFMRKSAWLGVSTATAISLANTVAAQEASPAASPAAVPVVSGAAMTSLTRDDYFTQLAEAFPREEPGATGGQFIHVNTSDIRILNPTLVTDTYSGYLTDYIFNYLVVESAIDGSYVPDLADYWEVSDDGLTYTFYLAQNATFHDGTPVTAHDVVFSFDSILDETSLSIRQSDVAQVTASYRAVDDHTFELVASGPYATTIEKSAGNVGIVPKHIWESIPFADWPTSPGSSGEDPAQVVGSGSFTFVEWVPGDHATIRRNDNYWDAERIPVVDEFIYRVVPEPQAAVQTLLTGESDVNGIPAAQAESVGAEPSVTMVDYDSTSFTYFVPHQDTSKVPFFADVRVRQALLHALDRQAAVDNFLFGYGIQADGTQPVLSNAYAPDQVNTIYNFDPDRARQLLEEAGWVDSDGDGVREKDGQKFSFEFLYSEGSQVYVQLVPYMQQAWGEVGIEMIPSQLPFPSLIEQVIAGTYQMAVAGFSWGVDGDQGVMFRSDAFPPDGFNRARYSNPAYDELNDQQLYELDPEKRRQLLIDQSNLINDDAAVGILFFSKTITAYNNRVHNFVPNGYGFLWSLPWVWVEQ